MVAYRRLDGPSATPLFPSLVELYSAVYAEPPYEEGPDEVAGFAARLPEESSRPGFTLVAAEDGPDLIGAAYGWTMSPGVWWSRADTAPAPEILSAAKLAVMEWIVHPDHRRRGIGAELMRRLLVGRPEAWATLASDPRSLARRLYEQAGWRKVGTSHLPWGPAMDLLVLPLPVH
ncbi:GNAT family N-acetyltransferase [Plantactinospora sp. BB1]|uniref:GNAT family N-acetyltransferase n=1 Tax=Plantactinospora sp. BB1 TaxID=2071627 RepID=UPI000D174A94|nr:GNAT family N-acetyltransferase [Plantactinospora sp. BB1]AVT40175.1 N-acetyltransferase [Plantactinospora sp. BB1]